MATIASIGLFKSGTRSLIGALRQLGFTSSEDTFNHARLGLWCGGWPALDYQDVQDEPVFGWWRMLAEAHPDLRFIMTVRDRDAWIKSLRKNMGSPKDVKVQAHVGKPASVKYKPRVGKGPGRLWLEQVMARAGQAPTLSMDLVLGVLGGGLDVSDEWLGRCYDEHHAAVREYFRPGWNCHRLLELDICGGDQWGPLCEWLDMPVPDVEFPHLNDSTSNTTEVQPFPQGDRGE